MNDDESRHHIDWHAVLATREAGIFLVGLACVLGILLWVVRTSPGKAGMILAVVTAHVTGGRASGIVVASNSHLFARWEIILLGSLIEGAVVCLFFPAFCLSVKKLIRVPWLTGAIENVHRSAESQRKHVIRWGVLGLLLFVWFPFLMTGPVVGSVIGSLLGMRPWVVVGVVLSGTVGAIISWTFLMDQVMHWTAMVGDFIPLLIVSAILVLVVAFRMKKVREAHGGRIPPPSPNPEVPPCSTDDP